MTTPLATLGAAILIRSCSCLSVLKLRRCSLVGFVVLTSTSFGQQDVLEHRMRTVPQENGSILVSWDATATESVAVGFSGDLVDWIELEGTDVVVENERAHWVDDGSLTGTSSMDGSRFYRLFPWSPKGVGFANPESDFAAVFLPRRAGEASLVFARDHGTGRARRLFFEFEQDFWVSAQEDAEGRLAELTAVGHRFVLSEYTATTVKVTHHAPGGEVTSEVVSLVAEAVQTMSLSSVRAISQDPTLSELTKDAAKWLVDMSNTHLFVHIYRLGGEEVAETVDRAVVAAQQVVEGARTLTREIKNVLSIGEVDFSDSADTLVEEAPVLVRELEQIDPDAQTTAGFTVTSAGVELMREVWDKLYFEKAISLEFTHSDVSCEESVFAEMNRDCPQFIPPQREGSLAAHDMVLETIAGEPVSQELGASGAQSFELVREPSHGTVTLHDIYSGVFTYQPNAGYIGADSFSFVAINSTGRSGEGVVSVSVLEGPNTAEECAAHWLALLPGKWDVVDHPFLKPDQNEWRENWSLEFKETSAGITMTERYDQRFYDGDFNPGVVSVVSYYIIYDDNNYDGSAVCALSYNKNPGNSFNQLLLSGGGADLKLRYFSQYVMSLTRQ